MLARTALAFARSVRFEREEKSMAKDPVCGMDVNDRDAKATAQHGGKSYNFCSTQCRDQFQQNPDRYARQSA
jgi:YHS domain-containing protein